MVTKKMIIKANHWNTAKERIRQVPIYQYEFDGSLGFEMELNSDNKYLIMKRMGFDVDKKYRKGIDFDPRTPPTDLVEYLITQENIFPKIVSQSFIHHFERNIKKPTIFYSFHTDIPNMKLDIQAFAASPLYHVNEEDHIDLDALNDFISVGYVAGKT